MKFLIVDATASGKGIKRSAIDVIGAGCRAIAGVLEAFQCKFSITRVEDTFVRPSAFQSFDVVMVSAMTMDEGAVRKVAVEFAGKIKVLGGPITCHPTAVGRLGFDGGVWGEGEHALAGLLSTGFFEKGDVSLLQDVPNIIFPDGSASKRVRLSLEEYNRYKPSVEAVRGYSRHPNYRVARVYVEVERGCSNFNRARIIADRTVCRRCSVCNSLGLMDRLNCPQGIPPGCGYCSIPAVYGYPKSKSEDIIYYEVKGLVRLGVRRIVLSGADFLDYGREEIIDPSTHPSAGGVNSRRIENLLRKVSSIPEVRSGRVYLSVENVKPSLLTDDVAALLARYLPNCVIHVGVETGDDEHSILLGRPCTASEAAESVKTALRHGLRVYTYFIHGLPGQSLRTARKTVYMIEEFYRLGVEKVTIYRFKPLPGSAFQNFNPAPPARRSRASMLIWSAAYRFNLERKKQLVGRRLTVLCAGRGGRYVIAYPLRGGPTVYVKGAPRLKVGDEFKVRITDVISDRLVLGVYAS